MILVTGGTGLVGAHLLLFLTENSNESVRAIYRNAKQIAKTQSLFDYYGKADLFPKIVWLEADILDVPSLENAFVGVTKVYHCAAFISFNPNDEEQLRKVNIEGTANIVNFCIAKNVSKLCHVSSIAALGELAEHESVITEESLWNPQALLSDYRITKYGAEMEVWRAQQEGVDVVVVNPGIILGPYPENWDKSQGSGALFYNVIRGMPFYTDGSTGYVAVTDLVKIMNQLMESSINNERFIVVAVNISYKDIIYKVADRLGAKKPKTKASYTLLKLAWRLDWLASKLFFTKRKLSRESAYSLVKSENLSSQKLINALSFSFSSIDDYLDAIIDSFKK